MKMKFEYEFFNELNSAQLAILEPIISNTAFVSGSKRRIYLTAAEALMPNSTLRKNCEETFSKFSTEEIAKSIGAFIKFTGIDVNASFLNENKDLMHMAIENGSVDDVKMLLALGYEGKNLVNGQTISYYYRTNKEFAKVKDMDKKLFLLNRFPCLDFKKELSSDLLKQYMPSNEYVKMAEFKRNSDKNLENLRSPEWDKEISISLGKVNSSSKGYMGLMSIIENNDMIKFDEVKVLNRMKDGMLRMGIPDVNAVNILHCVKDEENEKYFNAYLRALLKEQRENSVISEYEL